MVDAVTVPQGSRFHPELQLDDQAVDAILDIIYYHHGYDFRRYCRAHMKRRLRRRMVLSGISDLSNLQAKIASDTGLLNTLIADFSICVTEMFRDPHFFRALRRDVLSYLSTQPFIKIWVAGCATGEEAYSLAIMLHEEGIYERSLIYATDINCEALKSAQEGVFNAKDLRNYTENYQKAGGQQPFVNYYTASSGLARMNDHLKKNILFTHHNLAIDGSFGEMHLILCRNVLIYFNRSLHNRVFSLFHESLGHRGFLGIGSNESLQFSNCSEDFELWTIGEKIYRRRD